MDDWLKELSNKLVEFKYAFLEINNRLFSRFESLNSRYKNIPSLLQPCISNSVREVLNERLAQMQEATVNSIGICFKNFYIHALSNQQNKQSFLARRFDKDIIETLEESFKINPYPSDEEKMRIQKLHSITYRQVSNWFTNKRNRTRVFARRENNLSYSSENIEEHINT